jgi:hypothetical protein
VKVLFSFILARLMLVVLLAAITVPAVATAQAVPAPVAFDCRLVTQIPTGECQALVALYNSAGGPTWTEKAGWLASTTPCGWTGVAWAGVGCQVGQIGHVTSLSLGSHNLAGSIPPEFGNLTSLVYLELGNNMISGSIPSQFGNLSSLQQLSLGSNQLSGTIPPEMGNLSNVQALSLSDNRLSGSIPPELGRLANLKYLNLDRNQLSGNIPPEMGNLSNVQALILSDNRLSGSIPPGLGRLAILTYLDLQSNRLSGPIPLSLDRLRLGSFYFDDTVCAPSDPAFLAWLNGIQNHSPAIVCAAGEAYLPFIAHTPCRRASGGPCHDATATLGGIQRERG